MNPVYTLNLTRAERREKWRELISAHRTSLLKQKQFCELNGLRERDLRRWKYRLNRTKARIEEIAKDQENGEINFLAVEMMKVQGESRQDCMLKLELKHTSGFSLFVEEKTNDRILKKALMSLIESCRC